MSDCLFCRIVTKEIPSSCVYEDDVCYAFRDINPAAPVHVLVVPKKHIGSLDEVSRADAAVVGHIMSVIPAIAASEGVAGGYRVVSNIGPRAGQSVKHLHFHILGGRDLSWPPG